MQEEYITEKTKKAYDYIHNDSNKALTIFEEVLRVEPENIDAITGKGSTLMKLKRIDEAEKCFDQSLEICENLSALLNKGIILKHENDSEKAMVYFDRALKLNPDFKNIISILKGNLENDIHADEYSDEANRLIQEGMELKNENKLQDSLDCFKKAIEVDKNCEKQVSELIDEIKKTLEK